MDSSHVGLSAFDVRTFRIDSLEPSELIPHRHLDHLCQMQGMAIGALRDLLAATEAIGDDQTVWRSFPNCGQKFQFADRDRDFVFV